MSGYKQPVSVLVVIYTPALDVLLIERADKAGYWQSVTGSREGFETLAETARREVQEETGLDAALYRLEDWQHTNTYEIFDHWRARYAPGTTHNVEHVFGLEVPEPLPVRLAPGEHVDFEWLPWEAARDKVFSPSNAEAITQLTTRVVVCGR
ncbi:dihydroneopterin triphosphate diphosphatase [Crenobacter cavernae]|uniref:Dihydroneopterin triphosphate diphosphatase n=1 Tax=Crenobacter cavernae TaxID=2290923 RepID=A0A345Y9J0_9NEIS|nr:dihydroneopterin triphosphate diphosphatase [Crenobacter cavernae]AXK40592.1 dihydroneopterin triphosphate diphosphatase [Crenobacter cavernae]RXZ45267.1 dihydroneopterin triphosphate diphosphatase [Crenobacter cavernae]